MVHQSVGRSSDHTLTIMRNICGGLRFECSLKNHFLAVLSRSPYRQDIVIDLRKHSFMVGRTLFAQGSSVEKCTNRIPFTDRSEQLTDRVRNRDIRQITLDQC